MRYVQHFLRSTGDTAAEEAWLLALSQAPGETLAERIRAICEGFARDMRASQRVQTAGTPADTPRDDDNRRVTVCSVCVTASCWNGLFYCDGYKEAGTVDLTVAQLRALNREHPDYWRRADGEGRG
jgi:hypothetical protein